MPRDVAADARSRVLEPAFARAEDRDEHRCAWRRRAKRAMDLSGAALTLLAALPVVVAAAAAVKLASPGPAFYSHLRVGREGRPFRLWKLRTMCMDSEEVLAAHLAANPRADEEWRARFKLADDPRVIPGVGTFLRRFSIDELPQLWNVLRGEMSLVGPRPLPEYHLRRFPRAFRARRNRVRPGLTGLWQVAIRSDGGLEQQRLCDERYLEKWTLRSDLLLLAKTVRVVVRPRGAL